MALHYTKKKEEHPEDTINTEDYFLRVRSLKDHTPEQVVEYPRTEIKK